MKPDSVSGNKKDYCFSFDFFSWRKPVFLWECLLLGVESTLRFVNVTSISDRLKTPRFQQEYKY